MVRKKDNKGWLVIVILIAVASFFVVGGNLDFFAAGSAIRPDPFLIFDDFKLPVPELLASDQQSNLFNELCTIDGFKKGCVGEVYTTNMGSGLSSISQNVNIGHVTLIDARGSSSFLRINQNLEGYDIRILGSARTGAIGGGTTTFSFGGCSIRIQEGFEEFNIEFVSSRLNNNDCEVLNNGRFISSGSGVGEKILQITNKADSNFGTVRTTTIEEIDYLIPFATCPAAEGDILGSEVFSGGKSFSLFSTQRTVKRFCLELPAIIKKPEGFTATGEIYERLRRGEVLNVPSDELWLIHYLFKNDGTLPQCVGDESFDFAKSECVKASGFGFFCKGELDPFSGLCVDTLQDRCETAGGFYNTQDTTCLLGIPIQGLCSHISATYVPSEFKCLSTEISSTECVETGGIINQERGWCEWNPVSLINCGLLELENGDVVLPVFDPVSGFCEAEGTVQFKPGECSGTLVQNSASSFTCIVPPVLSFEKPTGCTGVLIELSPNQFVCKLKAENIVEQITIIKEKKINVAQDLLGSVPPVVYWIAIPLGLGVAFFIVRRFRGG